MSEEVFREFGIKVQQSADGKLEMTMQGDATLIEIMGLAEYAIFWAKWALAGSVEKGDQEVGR